MCSNRRNIHYSISANGELLRDNVPLEIPGFLFEKELGVGANGSVFLAEDIQLHRKIAIKVWNGLMSDEHHRALGEIQKLANIRHHNFVQVFSFNETKGVAYATMEFVNGQSLKQWFSSSTLHERVGIWTQYAAAMRYLHSTGIFHGDPHAGNVMLQLAPPGYIAPRLEGSYVHFETKYKVAILDTGTSMFWSPKEDFELREKSILVEMIDLMFSSHCLTESVELDPAISLEEIVRLGNALAVLFARNISGSPQGSENIESADEEISYVKLHIPDFMKFALQESYSSSNNKSPSRLKLEWRKNL